MIKTQTYDASSYHDKPKEMIVFELGLKNKVIGECNHENAYAPDDSDDTDVDVGSVGEIDGQVCAILDHAKGYAEDDVAEEVFYVPFAVDYNILVIPENTVLFIISYRIEQIVNNSCNY